MYFLSKVFLILPKNEKKRKNTTNIPNDIEREREREREREKRGDPLFPPPSPFTFQECKGYIMFRADTWEYEV